MITFWIIAALFILLALWFVLPPLLKKTDKQEADANSSANVLIYQNQLNELDADLKAGLISDELYQQEKDAIERRLLEDVNSATEESVRIPSRRTTALVYVVSAFIPVGAIALYLFVGNPNALSSSIRPTTSSTAAQPDGQMSQQQIAANVDKLAERLRQKPNDAQGWLMLARSYVSMERFSEAAAAYEQLTKLSPSDADAWADYAEALAMANSQNLSGKPTEAIDRALQIDPKHRKALHLAGSAAYQKGDYRKAIDYWQKLLTTLPAGSTELRTISDQIAKAKELAGGKSPR